MTVHIGRWRWMALSGGGRKVRRLFSARNLVLDRRLSFEFALVRF